MKKLTIYVIKSREGYKYTGMTEDLEKRLDEHNRKILSFWTKRGSDWKLFYKEEFDSATEAIKREKWLKTGHGRAFLNDLECKKSEVQSA
jgi:putative endonuclease